MLRLGVEPNLNWQAGAALFFRLGEVLMDKGSSEVIDTTRLDANRMALEYVRGLSLPQAISIDASSFDGLPRRSKQLAMRGLDSLHRQFAGELPKILSYALKHLWYAAASAGFYMKLMSEIPQETKVVHELCDPIGYAEHEGWSYTLYNQLSNIDEEPEEQALRDEAGIADRLAAESVLNCISIYYYFKAAEALTSKDHGLAMASLGEAGEASALSDGVSNFDAGWTYAKEELAEDAASSARTAIARSAAAGRHRENREAKQKVFAWCDENMNRFKSMDEAAWDIAGTFVSQAFSTVRAWMTEWKKLRSTGRP